MNLVQVEKKANPNTVEAVDLKVIYCCVAPLQSSISCWNDVYRGKCALHLRLQKIIHSQIEDFSENAVKSSIFVENRDFSME